jgi:D-serine deaminase-like pyridoxal phosphate-dependent protein
VLKSEIVTPALLVEMAAMEFNLKKMAAFFEEGSARLRPHDRNGVLWI